VELSPVLARSARRSHLFRVYLTILVEIPYKNSLVNGPSIASVAFAGLDGQWPDGLEVAKTPQLGD
jgi:hypothetical protein